MLDQKAIVAEIEKIAGYYLEKAEGRTLPATRANYQGIAQGLCYALAVLNENEKADAIFERTIRTGIIL